MYMRYENTDTHIHTRYYINFYLFYIYMNEININSKICNVQIDNIKVLIYLNNKDLIR